MRAGPSRLQRLHPIHLARAARHDYGRERIDGYGGYAAAGVVQRRGVAYGLRREVAGRISARPAAVIHALLLGVVDERHRLVAHIVEPSVGHHAVRRRHRSRRDGCERHGGSGLHIVVRGVGEYRAALGEASESSVREVSGVTVEIVGAHRAYDDVHHKTRPSRVCEYGTR